MNQPNEPIKPAYPRGDVPEDDPTVREPSPEKEPPDEREGAVQRPPADS